MTTTPQVELRRDDSMGTTSGGVHANAEGSTTPYELGAQIRAALEQAHQPPSAVTATIRVRHQDTRLPLLATAEVWTVPAGAGAPCRACDLPAAFGLRMALVEEALDQAEVSYPRADLGLRARWRRLTGAGGAAPVYELVISLQGDSNGGPTWAR